MKLGFIGTGAITSAIVTGLNSAELKGLTIRLSPRNSAVSRNLANRFPHVSVAHSNQDVLDGSEVVVVAVTPQLVREVLSRLRFRRDHHVISLVSACSLGRFSELVTPAATVTRAVPLPSAARRSSPTAIYPRDEVAFELFASLGTAFEVDTEFEFEALCTATATIASYFAFADSIASWLARQQIPEVKAQEYVAKIFSGVSASTIESSGRTFQSFAADYATPGGINEQVLSRLTERGVFKAVPEVLDAVVQRLTGASA